MKKLNLNFATAIILILLTGITSLYAEDFKFPVDEYGNDYTFFADKSTYVAQVNAGNTNSSGAESTADINMHKILGWSTLASALATFAAIGLGGKDLHCGLAYTSTALAVATCTTGYYSYSDVLGNDTLYTTHALLGTLATAGFGAALAMADGGPHAVVGASSGVVFVFTIGMVYF